MDDALAEFPHEVAHGASAPSVRYVLAADRYCLRLEQPGAPVADALAVFDEGRLVVHRGDFEQAPPRNRGVVYRREPGGALAIPTGQLFVRFRDGTDASSQAGLLARAGYEIVSIPAYAAHCAWVRARSGSVAQALARAGELAAIAGVCNVEPQMLMEAQRKP